MNNLVLIHSLKRNHISSVIKSDIHNNSQAEMTVAQFMTPCAYIASRDRRLIISTSGKTSKIKYSSAQY